MQIEAILKDFLKKEEHLKNPFPMHLGFEMKENYYIRLVYWQKDDRVKYGHEIELYNKDVDENDLKKNQKRFIVRHLMNRLKYKFAFDFSDSEDRFYVRKINSLQQLKENLNSIYALLDQQIGIADTSLPKTFFE